MTTVANRLLRLHVYDHCPFSMRVELALGWMNIPYERSVYGYGDRLGDATKADSCYDGGVVLTGKKALPVLEELGSDGTREWLKSESMEIVDWALKEHGVDEAAFPKPSGRDDLNRFFSFDGPFIDATWILSRPRNLRMTHLTDWAREEDRAYCKAKYESGGFDYAAAEAADAETKVEMEALLREADGLLKSESSLYQTGTLGYDDVLYLPLLRCLTLVEGLVWPERLRNYVVSAYAKAKVGTYFDHQIA
mmetsp:Transcript_15009/g.34796  ORF Transcript_15009/g.34796 Transcript_15009/m.34796 type:complete len:250 (+) Transcript_15009:691-1440(+)